MTVRDQLLDEWELAVDGPTGAVLPVRTADGAPAVLKLGAAEHEALALQHWRGRGAVRLLRADPRRGALLLERLEPADLADHWDVEACEIVAGLYAELHVAAPPQLTRLSARVRDWRALLATLPRDAPVPRRLVEQASALARDLAADDQTDGRLLHTDLHYATVLARPDGGWAAISPNPLNGDPHHEVAPLLWHRWEELAGDVRRGLRARFHAAVDAAALDEHRARDWVVLRMVVAAAAHPDDATRVTRCVTVAKAVQD